MPHLIVFSHLRWNFVYQRPQHLLSRLGQHYHVLFVEEPLRDDGPPRLERMRVADHVEVLRPFTPVEAPGFHDDQISVLRPLLADVLREQRVDDYLAWFYTPMALPLLAGLKPRAVVYDCMDELAAFKDAPRQMRQREQALIKQADVVLTGGPSLYEAKRHLHPNVLCLPSAVDAAHYAPQNITDRPHALLHAEQLQGRIPGPRLGFFGVIDERIDLELLQRVADARPDWQVVMVGPVVKIDPTTLPRRPNLHWLGQQPYELLPQLVAGWEVCLLPFALNETTRFISPTKTLEYLAAEKPVVSTAVHDVVSLYGDVVRIARDAEAFVEACHSALAETTYHRTERLNNSIATVSRYSWDKTVQTIHHALQSAIADGASTGASATSNSTAASGASNAASGSAAATRPTATSGAAGAVSNAPAAGAAPLASSTRRQVRHIVVGAGPTGLSAAYHLGLDGKPEETLLVEREGSVGGWCRSVVDKGFTFDYAGHIMFSNDPYVLKLYDTLLGDNQHWQNREAWIYSKNVYTRYPFQGALYGLPPQVLKECIVGAIEARFGPLKGGEGTVQSAPPANFREFIDRVWGKGIGKHFAVPYNEKLWAVPLDEMETSWLGGRVPLPDLEQMIEGALTPSPKPMGPNARFGYPLRGGFQALMDGFVPRIQGEIALNTSVVAVSPETRTVRLDDGRTLQYETLISTMPLPALVAACGDEAPAEVQAAAKGLRHVSVRNVNLGVARENLTDKHWIYYPEDTVFHRIFVQGNASPHNNPPGGFALIAEITYSPSKPLPCDGQALIDRVVADCKKVGLMREDDTLITAHQLDMPCAYVVYDHDRAKNVETIRQWFSERGVVLAGRYSEWEYYNSDHAFIAGKKAAEQAREAANAPLAARAG